MVSLKINTQQTK